MLSADNQGEITSAGIHSNQIAVYCIEASKKLVSDWLLSVIAICSALLNKPDGVSCTKQSVGPVHKALWLAVQISLAENI